MPRQKALNASLRLTLVIGSGDAAPRSLPDIVVPAFKGGVTALQLREKNLPDREFHEEALALKSLCAEFGKLFIVNNRLDIALAADADGVHLGGSDLPVHAAARLLPKNKLIGFSAGSREEGEEALAQGADYLGVGALYPSPSKPEAGLLDAETVASIVSLKRPAVGIGGITRENAPQAWARGFTGLALISAFTQADDPEELARALLSGCI
ncbi:MAG: thiamine phosphate synthase [Deltaproteobacteria bacterium]|jgi:thiamine-phosphate pyrophosphorylase|nr:thiamine phosphate synthase [Deltaproteobacteria bacterium]